MCQRAGPTQAPKAASVTVCYPALQISESSSIHFAPVSRAQIHLRIDEYYLVVQTCAYKYQPELDLSDVPNLNLIDTR